MRDAYTVLGVPRSASRLAIHRRYRSLDASLGVPPRERPPAGAPRPAPRAPAKDPIQQWRDHNRSLQRTVNTILGLVAGGMFSLRFALLADTPRHAFAILVGGLVLGFLAGYLLRRFDIFGIW